MEIARHRGAAIVSWLHLGGAPGHRHKRYLIRLSATVAVALGQARLSVGTPMQRPENALSLSILV